MSDPSARAHLLLVEDDPQARKSTLKILELENYAVSAFENPEDALRFMNSESRRIDAIVSDIRMPKMSGLEFLRALSAQGFRQPVILMTAYGAVEDAVYAMKWGVVDFLTKPFKRVDLLAAVEVALVRGAHASATASAQASSKGGGAAPTQGDWIGKSPEFLALNEEIAHIAPTQATVLITGESGTGKERVARELHSLSARAKNAFIPLNCAAVQDSLLESELFGFEKGSFTGADQARAGLFEAAHQGTLFLDEIGELSLAVQAKLLRVLADGEIRRIGSTTAKKVSVRLITATHRDLRERVKQGLFREDLFYRLEVVHLKVPALRARRGDIPEIALHYLRHFGLEHQRKVYGISDDALAKILAYPWPGNVRELRNAIARAVVYAKTDAITVRDLPEIVANTPIARGASTSDDFLTDPDSEHLSIRVGTPLRDVEELLIRKTLERSQGDKGLTAKLLGINQRTIYRKLQEKEGDSE